MLKENRSDKNDLITDHPTILLTFILVSQWIGVEYFGYQEFIDSNHMRLYLLFNYRYLYNFIDVLYEE